MNKVKDGYKMTELGEIPSDWKIKKLGEITVGKGEYGIGASATEYIEGKPRYLRITDIGDSCRLLFNDIKGLDGDEYEKYILKEGDIVFARTGNTTGKGYVYNKEHGELVYAGFLIKYSINNNIAKHNFIKYVIQSKRYWNWVNIMSTRSGQPGINSNEYSSFIVQLPPLKEQEKIASILSTVDEEIDNVDELIQKNKELKKGLMQQLLTKGIGHTKFKKTEIGEIPEGWEVKKLSDVSWYQEGPGLRKWQFKSEGLKVINVTNLVGKYLDLSNTSRYIDKSEVEKKYKHFLIDENDIVVASSGNSWGKVSSVRREDLPLLMNTSVIRFKTLSEEEATRGYLLHFLRSDSFNKQIALLITGSAQPNFGPYHLERTKIAIPSIKEQIKIASILSKVDEKIEEYENKKEKLEEIKKGLMQQLLTGAIRVL